MEKEEINKNSNNILKNTLSLYIIKEILSFLDKRKVLNLFIYSKFKEKLEINIEDYKKLSDKYKIGESNGEGKEYKKGTKKLIFEGKYLNNKKNGNGKEYYYNGELKFKGEYIKGKKNGKGKEYNYCGNVIFEGEYLNDERNGNGKEYYHNGKLKFEGEYIKGKRWKGKGYDKLFNLKYELKNGNGKIIEYRDDGLIKFEGEYLNGEKHGEGKEYNYYGMYVNNDYINYVGTTVICI